MSAQRFMFLDVARGIAVLWMIQVHITNQLIDPAIRSTIPFRALNLSNGYVAPTFIFCAGAGLWIALSRKGDDFLAGGGALWDYLRRLAFILFWAFLLHTPLYSLERWLHATPVELVSGLQFDVLHTIVLASLTVLGVFLAVRHLAAATWITAGLTVAVMSCSSFVWSSDPSSWAPTMLAYAIGPLSPFPYLPWSGYLFAGVAVGSVVMRAPNKERLAKWLLGIGVLLPAVIFIVKWMPVVSPYDATWWKTSPGMHLFRICGTLTLLGLLMLMEPRLRESRLGAQLQLIGNESLFMYISHLMIVYGAVGAYLRDALGVANSGYLTIIIAWVVVTVPLLVAMHWWHSFKRRRPERARDILALQVIMFITYFLIAPQAHTFD